MNSEDLFGINTDIVPAWRNEATEFHLRIGDALFFIPPSRIGIKTVTNVSTMKTVRSKSSIKTKSGYSQTEIHVEMYFADIDQINGFEISAPDGSTYYMDGLRALLAQFKRTPILPVVNEKLNITHGIHTVCMSAVSAFTDPKFPNSLGIQLVLHKTTVAPYLMKPDIVYDSMIAYPMFRWYYQQLLRPVSYNTRKNGTWLKPVTGNMTGFFKFRILDPEALHNNDLQGIRSGSKMVEVEMPLDEISITSMTLTTHNLFTAMNVQLYSDPCHQFMGSLDTSIFVIFQTINHEIVRQFVEMRKIVEENSLNYHDKFVSGFLEFENELCQLFGVSHVMIQGMDINTIDGEPDATSIAMALVSYDPNQKDNEEVDGWVPFHDKTKMTDQVQNIVMQNMETAPSEYLQTMIAEEMLNNLELYPDLDLPTYAETESMIGIVNKQRAQKKLADMDYKLYIPPPLRGKDYSGYRVDPDFYVNYGTLNMAGIINPEAMNQALFAPESYTANAAALTYAGVPATTVASMNNSAPPAGQSKTFELTAYCACQLCCGPNAKGITASGAKVKAWHTIAVDPRVIPMGTWVYIPYFADKPNGGWFRAEDTGGAIKGNRIDVYYTSHNEALRFGRKQLPVIVTNEKGTAPPSGGSGSYISRSPRPEAIGALNRTIGTGFQWPMKRAVVTSPFGMRNGRPHQGVDLDGGDANPIYASMSGIVILATTNDGYGLCVKIDHGNGYITLYGHMQKILVTKGQTVTTNTVLGLQGNTGNSRGSHLHFEIIKGGTHVDPAPYLKGNPTTLGAGAPSYGNTSFTSAGDLDLTSLPKWMTVESPPEMVKPYGTRIEGAPDPETPEGRDELTRQMSHDWLNYSWDGRIVKAFPTYSMLILDEGIWSGGRRVWTNYYTYHSMLEMTIIRDRTNPVDLAMINLTNIYGSLNAKTRYMQPSGVSFFGTVFPTIDAKMIEDRANILKAINLKAGARVHIRVGHGSIAEALPIAFNGVIADIDSKDTMTIVCQGDGVELIDPILEWDVDQINGISNIEDTPWVMFYMILADRGLAFHFNTGAAVSNVTNWMKDQKQALENIKKKWEDGEIIEKDQSFSEWWKRVGDNVMNAQTGDAAYESDDQGNIVPAYTPGEIQEAAGEDVNFNDYQFGDMNPYGIEHFGFVYKNDDMLIWSGDPERSTDQDRAKPINAYDVMKNIWDRNPAKSDSVEEETKWILQLLGIHSFGKDQGGGAMQMYIGGKSPWDIFKTIASCQRDRIVGIHPYHFRSTLFYGQPHWPVKYAMRLKDGIGSSGSKTVVFQPNEMTVVPPGQAYAHTRLICQKLGIGFDTPVYNERDKTVSINGKVFKPLKLDEKSGKSFLWIRDVAQFLGWTVKYDKTTGTVTCAKGAANGGTDWGTKKEHYEELYKPYSQFWVYNSYTNILDNGIRASSTEIVTNACAVFSVEGKPITSRVVKADSKIKRELQKTDMFDSTVVQDSFIPNFLPWTETVLPFLGFSSGENRALEMCRSHLRDKFKQMYQGELVILGAAPKPYDVMYINDPYNKMSGTADVGRVVIHMGFSTGFVTSIKPDLSVAIAGSERNAAYNSLTRTGLLYGTYLAKGILASCAAVAVTDAIYYKQLGPRALNFLKNELKTLKGIRGAITGLKAIGAGAVAATVGTSAALATMLGFIFWDIVLMASLGGLIRIYDDIMGVYGQELRIYPLWYKGMPYVAGIDGHQTLIPGLKDPWYYADPLNVPSATGSPGATTSTGAEQGGDDRPLSSDPIMNIVAKLGYTYDEFTPTSGSHRQLPGTGSVPGLTPTEDVLDTVRPRYLRWPTMSRKITEVVDWRMEDNGKKKHPKGLDIAGSLKDPVFAAASGVVRTIGTDPSPNGIGKYVVIEHAGGTKTVYGNLGEVNVSVGQRLDCSKVNNSVTIVGTIGDSAKDANGMDQQKPHLHFDIVLSDPLPKGVTLFHFLE